MREVKRIRRFICSSGRCPHVISNRTVGVGFLALVLVCNGCLLLARYELSRDQALLDRAIAVVTALTRTTVAVSNSIGLPKRLSVKIVEAAENISHRMVALSPDAAQLHLHKALVLIDFARIQREFGSSELERTRASQADSLLKGLAAKRLGDPAWQRDVSVAHSKLGDLLQAQNRLEEAYAHYDASRAILEGHAANSSAASKRALATSFMKMGDVDIARGSLNEALVNYDASLAIMDRLARRRPAIRRAT
jgi:tetratricopeptide (TPR) repeat protein